MAIPSVDIEVLDGGLGLSEGAPTQSSLSIGISSKGTENTMYAFTDVATLRSTLGQGPLVEAVALKLLTAGGTQYAMPATRTTLGACGATTETGTGTGAVTGDEAPIETITVVCTTAGALGTAQFTFKLGTATASAPVVSAAGWGVSYYAVPGTLTRLTFTAGDGFDVGDTWTISPLGVITQTVNAGAATGTIGSQVSSPMDELTVIVKIVTGGALGAGTFRYSLDGGDTYFPDATGEITIPSGGKYHMGETGVFLTFASATYVAGDLFSFSATAPSYSTSDATSAATAADADDTEWSLIHFVGTPSSSANAATLASIVDTSVATMESNFRYVRAFVECPTSESDATVKAAFASFTSTRVAVGAGDAEITSPIAFTGIKRRNITWAAVARACLVGISEDLARVRRGPLRFVTSLWRDERATPALDVGRFTTARTFKGKRGFYLTNARLMSEDGSDYKYLQHGRIMDEACRVAYDALTNWLSDGVRVDPATGFIDERDALAIEAEVRQRVIDALKGHISGDPSIRVARDENIISTETITIDIRIVPKAYAKQIAARIGYRNPALSGAIAA